MLCKFYWKTIKLLFFLFTEAAKGEQKKFGGGSKPITDSRAKRSQEKERSEGKVIIVIYAKIASQIFELDAVDLIRMVCRYILFYLCI